MSLTTSPLKLLTRPRHRRRAAVVTGTVAALALGGVAAGNAIVETINPPAFPRAEIHAPTPMPDRIVLNPTDDMTTSQSVTWRTRSEVSTAQAQIAPTGPGPDFDDAARTVTATSTVPRVDSLGNQSRFHTAVFEGLNPDSAYLYRVGDGTNWSEWLEFETAAATAEPFSFIYYGDAQNGVHQHVSRVFRKAFADRPKADVWLHAGDLVNTADNDAEWGEWFDAAGWVDGTVNTIATPGNHEYRSGALSPYWDTQFNFPQNGPASIEAKAPGTVYYADYQGVRFVSLNTNLNNDVDMAAQAEWLDGVLAENPNQWSVVTWHHPAFATTGTRNNTRVRQFLLPVVEKHDVDLVLQGHDHSYARGNLVNDRMGRSAIHNGTVYVVSVSGEKMYKLNNGENWTNNGAEQEVTGEGIQLYQLIDVKPGQIRYEARTADGEFYDGIVVTKNEQGEKKVVTVDEGGKQLAPAHSHGAGEAHQH